MIYGLQAKPKGKWNKYNEHKGEHLGFVIDSMSLIASLTEQKINGLKNLCANI